MSINKYIELLNFKLKWFSVDQYDLEEFNKNINILKRTPLSGILDLTISLCFPSNSV